MDERDRIVICYCRSENQNPNFCQLLQTQLQGWQNAQQGRSQPRVELFDDEQLDASDGLARFRHVLSHACVVVLLEGPDFMSRFLQDEQPLAYVETQVRYDAAKVLRVPIRPVVAVPGCFGDLQSAWSGEPLRGLDGNQRDLAMVKIVRVIAQAFLDVRNQTPEAQDELDAPPFVIDRANLEHPITVFPARIWDWAQQARADLDEDFQQWISQHSANAQLHPEWNLELPQRVPPSLFDVGHCARLEQHTARLYPRCRDAQLALYNCLNDHHVGSVASSVEALPHSVQNAITRLQMQDENKQHARAVMRALFRKHGAMWDAVNELWPSNQRRSPAARNELLTYRTVWQCIPLCELGVLQLLDHACCHHYVNRSLRQCYQMVDRVCHWLHMTNRLMNQVDRVSDHALVEDYWQRIAPRVD